MSKKAKKKTSRKAKRKLSKREIKNKKSYVSQKECQRHAVASLITMPPQAKEKLGTKRFTLENLGGMDLERGNEN